MEEVKNIYSDISEWLKFIEAKHAGVFAVWAAILIAIISNDRFWAAIVWEKVIMLTVVFMGLFIEMVSFFPLLNSCSFIKDRCYKKYSPCRENCVFFQSVFVATYCKNDSKVEIEKYKKLLISRGVFLENSLLVNDYLNQVIDLAQVTVIKTYLFEIIIKYTVSILVIFLVSVIFA